MGGNCQATDDDIPNLSSIQSSNDVNNALFEVHRNGQNPVIWPTLQRFLKAQLTAAKRNTRQAASSEIAVDILESPSRRSVKTMGTSLMV